MSLTYSGSCNFSHSLLSGPEKSSSDRTLKRQRSFNEEISPESRFRGMHFVRIKLSTFSIGLKINYFQLISHFILIEENMLYFNTGIGIVIILTSIFICEFPK